MRKALLILLFSSFVFTYATGAKRKAIYIVVDGIPADQIERLQPPAIFDIASKGAYARSYTGGEVGAYTETPTISAPGYANLLTATWAYKHNVWGNDNLKVNYTITGHPFVLPRSRRRTTPPASSQPGSTIARFLLARAGWRPTFLR